MNPFVYEPRAVEFLGVVTAADHRLKAYALRSSRFARAPLPEPRAIERMLEAGLPDPVLEADHKVGFGILHWANDGLYVLVNTWYDANMLRLRVFSVDDLASPSPTMTALDHLRVIACVWELEIYKHERDAWVREVLAGRPERLEPEVLEPYLADGFSGLA